jgi:hypothetical protein
MNIERFTQGRRYGEFVKFTIISQRLFICREHCERFLVCEVYIHRGSVLTLESGAGTRGARLCRLSSSSVS